MRESSAVRKLECIDDQPWIIWKTGAQLKRGDLVCESNGDYYEVGDVYLSNGKIVARLLNINDYRVAPTHLAILPHQRVRIFILNREGGR